MRASGAVDRFCHLTGPKRTRIDLGGVDLVWGWQMKKNHSAINFEGVPRHFLSLNWVSLRDTP
jgi:hypothetical protein